MKLEARDPFLSRSPPCYYRRILLQSGFCVTIPKEYAHELGWKNRALLKITKKDNSIVLEEVKE